MADITAAILTVSDRGSRGEREDTSSLEIRTLLESVFIAVVHYDIGAG